MEENKMQKVMKLLDERTGRMECKVCGQEHYANKLVGGRYKRGSWKCRNGCELE